MRTAGKRRRRYGAVPRQGLAEVVGPESATPRGLHLQGDVWGRTDLPDLPAGWHLEGEHRAAHDEEFSGDFTLVRWRGGLLDVVLVDIAGHGRSAGMRALALHGAFGALLGAVSAESFLPTANAYLIDQCWDDGFASAVHLQLELESGRFTLAAAGHPPALHLVAAAESWQVRDQPHGPVLGVVPEAHFPVHSGQLVAGDALLLYTDGLVEGRGVDLDTGTDDLVSAARSTMGAGLRLQGQDDVVGVASTICDRVRTGDDDDRTLVVLRCTSGDAAVPERDAAILIDHVPSPTGPVDSNVAMARFGG